MTRTMRARLGRACVAAALAVIALFSPGARSGDLAAQASEHVGHLPFVAATDAQSGVQFMNLSASVEAEVTLQLFGDGRGLLAESTQTAAPLSALNTWMPGLALDGLMSLRAVADQPLGGLVRTDWPGRQAAALYNMPRADTELLLPLFLRNWWGAGSTYLSVQNTSTEESVEVHAHVRDGAGVGVLTVPLEIPPGEAARLDAASDALSALGHRFLGSLRLTSGAPITAQAFGDAGGHAVYGHAAVPMSAAERTLYAPLFRAKQRPNPQDPTSGRIDTGYSVQNAGDAPAKVHVEYFGAGGSCAGQDFKGPAVTIPPGAAHVFYQGDPGAEGLPVNCFGAAKVVSEHEPIVGVAIDSTNLGMTSAAFNLAGSSAAATKVALPLWRRNHTAKGFSTGVAVMNVGSADALIELEFRAARADGSSLVATERVRARPHETAIFWPPNIVSLPDEAFGAAVVTSSEPVAVIVNDVRPDTIEGTLAPGADMATYSGLAIPAE